MSFVIFTCKLKAIANSTIVSSSASGGISINGGNSPPKMNNTYTIFQLNNPVPSRASRGLIPRPSCPSSKLIASIISTSNAPGGGGKATLGCCGATSFWLTFPDVEADGNADEVFEVVGGLSHRVGDGMNTRRRLMRGLRTFWENQQHKLLCFTFVLYNSHLAQSLLGTKSNNWILTKQKLQIKWNRNVTVCFRTLESMDNLY